TSSQAWRVGPRWEGRWSATVRLPKGWPTQVSGRERFSLPCPRQFIFPCFEGLWIERESLVARDCFRQRGERDHFVENLLAQRRGDAREQMPEREGIAWPGICQDGLDRGLAAVRKVEIF